MNPVQTPIQLPDAVREFVESAKRNPGMVTPEVLDQLEQTADSSLFGSHSAPAPPVSPLTWSARTLFLGSATTSERVVIDVPFNVLIVGCLPTLSVLSSGSGTATPTLNDIDVQIDLNQQVFMTQGQGTYTQYVGGTPQFGSTFVTLGALSMDPNYGGRLLNWLIKQRGAQLGVTFRWTQSGASPVFHDTIVDVAFAARQLAA